jgi:hypothetical protein
MDVGRRGLLRGAAQRTEMLWLCVNLLRRTAAEGDVVNGAGQ